MVDYLILYDLRQSSSEYQFLSELPQYLSFFHITSPSEDEMMVYAVYKYITPEVQKVIDIQILRIIGFL
jgi:hypothetical protein